MTTTYTQKEVPMSYYRISELDLSNRVRIGQEMLRPISEREWGYVTHLADKYNISRETLYTIRDRAKEGLINALRPRKPGPKPDEQTVITDGDFLQRAVTVLAMLKGSVRDIQLGLELLFGVSRSEGWVSETLQAVGAAAATYNASHQPTQPVLGELDETFQGRQPCLTVVDGYSFMVLNLSAADRRDGATWGMTLLDLAERGIQFQNLVSDGAKGIRAGVENAELAAPLWPDLFHLTQDAHTITQRLERAAYGAIETADRARRAERERQAPQRRPGRPLKVKISVADAVAAEEAAIDLYDGWCWLWREARQALEPINAHGLVMTTQEVCETMEVAITLLQELGHEGVTDFALTLQDHLDDLVAPLVWLEERLAPWQAKIDADTEALILWAWQHRHALDLEPGEGFPTAHQPVARAFWDIFARFHRSSSLVESFHSWLRPYLTIHRGMPQWLFPLLTLRWNHHTFQRGKREGSSPLELAGVADARSLSEALDQVLRSMDPREPEVPEETETILDFEALFSSEPAFVAA